MACHALDIQKVMMSLISTFEVSLLSQNISCKIGLINTIYYEKNLLEYFDNSMVLSVH